MFLTSRCGQCPSNYSEFNINRPLFNTRVTKLGKRIGTIDNYRKTRQRSGFYTQLLKSTTVWNHLKNARPETQFPYNPDSPTLTLFQIRRKNGEAYLGTKEGRKFKIQDLYPKDEKVVIFDANKTYKFNSGGLVVGRNSPEERALFVKQNISLRFSEGSKLIVSSKDTITFSNYDDALNGSGTGAFNRSGIALYRNKNSDGTPFEHRDTCEDRPCEPFTDDWSQIGGPGDGLPSIPRVLSNKSGYKARLINTIPGVDVKHNSYARYLARKKGNISSCNHF